MNNRMYLTHRPSGRSVLLGKRGAWGWYTSPADLVPALEELFAFVECDPATVNQDDFTLVLEDNTNTTAPTWAGPIEEVSNNVCRLKLQLSPPLQPL